MKLSGVILAAGCSTRAGGFKLARTILGKPVIEYVVDSMKSVCGDVTVVTGHMKEKLSYLPDRYDNLKVVFNRSYMEGMFSSVVTGLNAFDADYAVVCPGDCPAVSPDTYRRVAEGDYGIKVPYYEGVPGHPVCIRRDLVSSLRADGYKTLKEFIKSRGCHQVIVDDPAILMDVDYPEDFKKAEEYLRGRMYGHHYHRGG